MNKQQATIHDLLNSTRFDPDAPEPADTCIFRMHWKRILNIGDYMLFTGKKGTGKTKIVSAAIASALTGSEIFNLSIKLPANKRRVMHLDTEQGRTSHYRMMKLIIELGNMESHPPIFSSHRCRGIRPDLIRRMIEHYIYLNPDCGIIFLDGMMDAVNNMNDVVESKRLKEWMESISERHQIAIAGVMHRGFSADKAIGHAGSYLERGAQTVLKIEKQTKDGITFYQISAEHIREDSPPPETAFYYNVRTNAWELFELVETTEQSREPRETGPQRGRNSFLQFDIPEHRRRVGQIFNSTGLLLDYDRLISEIQMAYACSRTEARGPIYQGLLNEGLIFRNENGFTDEKQVKLFIEKK